MQEELIKFNLPEAKEVEVVLIKLEDGTIVARTVEELKKNGKEQSEQK
jgi:hypothetical protein